MIQITALGLLAIFTIYYIYFVTRVRIGLFSLGNSVRINHSPPVSVIVAARNEEKIIDRCLKSLLRQSFPADKYEVIIVDDNSNDNTGSVVESYARSQKNIKLIAGDPNDSQIGRGKARSISKGIENASGEIIMTTDADCAVPERWIEIMTSYFQNDIMLVAGPVAEESSTSFFSGLERLEFLGIIATGAGLIGSGRPIICNGANLAYRKSAFEAAGGFNDHDHPNDDEALMNRIAVRNIGKIAFAADAGALVLTQSSNTIMSFMRQRIRWANKRRHYEDKSILFTLVCLYMFFFSIAFTAALIPFNPQLLLPLLLAFGGKISVDYFTLLSGAGLFRQKVPVFYFLIAELLHVPYILIAAAIAQIASIQWKGREISK